MRGLELGLVDGLGDLHETLRTRFGEDVRTKLIEPKRGLFQLPRLASAVAADRSAAAVEDRAALDPAGIVTP